MTRFILVLTLAAALSGESPAQAVHANIPDTALPEIIAGLDAKHFDAFNSCDLDALRALYAPDVEFFHDLNGRVLDREQFIQAVKRNICGKVHRRTVAGTMAVYPMAKIGALQTGQHCFASAGKPGCIQQGRYTILWRFDGAGWQISKVFSYDHRPMAGE